MIARAMHLRVAAFGLAIALVALPASGALKRFGDDLPQECGMESIDGYTYRALNQRIVLNSTGISRWEYLNPRRPQAAAERMKLDAEGKLIKPTKDEDDKDSDGGGETGRQFLRESRVDAQWNECAEQARVVFENASAADAFLVTIPYSYARKSATSAAKKIKEKNLPNLEERIDNLSNATKGSCGICEEARGLYDDIKTLLDRKAWDRAAELIRRVNHTAWVTIPKKASPPQKRLREALSRMELRLEEIRQAQDSVDRDPNCDPDEDECELTFALFQGQTRPLDEATWKRLIQQSDGLLEFTVGFYDEESSPSNSTGYIQVRSRFDEPGSKTGLQVKASGSYRQDPELDAAPSDGEEGFFSPAGESPEADDRYAGGTLKRFPASARIELTQTLGTRASSKVVGSFKSDDLGGDQTGDFNVSQWEATFFSISGAALRFGEFTFAAPASKIAINEKGEGYQMNWRWLSGSHILKRESLSGTADDADRDNEAVLLQATDIAVNYAPLLRDLDLFYLKGKKRGENERPFDYTTWGAQLDWAVSESATPKLGRIRNWVSGTLAYFESERKPDLSFPVPKDESGAETEGFEDVTPAEGDSTLFEIALNQTRDPADDGERATQLRTFSVRYAVGSGDRAGTTELDEGYLGETAAFAPDEIFLGRFASRLREAREPAQPEPEPEPGAPMATARKLPPQLVGEGLANKRYLGVTYVEQEKWWRKISPLWLVAKFLQVELKDVKYLTTTFRYHGYRFREPVLGATDAGWEAGIEWFLEAPKGVKTTLKLAKYFPGDATKPFFAEYPTVIDFNVALTLK